MYWLVRASRNLQSEMRPQLWLNYGGAQLD
jgi:hypothetical protein